MSRNDSADYAWNQDGHLHSPLCRSCRLQPAVITCREDNSVLCYGCFQRNSRNCVTYNHPQPDLNLDLHLQLPGPSAGPGPSGGPGIQNKKNEQLGALPLLPVQAMTQQATRHARRVYVGGLPPTANKQSVATFFSQVMSAVGGNTAGPGEAVVNVYINHEKNFAFVEMRTVEEASNAMALDGIILDYAHLQGVPVKVKRPTDYNPSLAAALGPSQPNPNLNLAAVGFSSGSTGGLEGPDRLFVGGIPYHLTEDQIRELLESFGPLRGFNLVKDRETGNSMG
ncbi:BnaC09g14510D [Brassica napus]|uniref:BnaC09g14510D protein n=1 Tax=Brassica napus TaxID=3708 RepID=A0A078HUN8_BRANA|nr:BnaC09g14510D [Brassica napus]